MQYTQTHSQTKSISDQNYNGSRGVSHVILNNNTHSMDTCFVVLHSICTASSMSKAMAQNMKPTKSRMNRLLYVLCPHEFIKLITMTILYANNFTWLSRISTVSYCILSVRYFEVECDLISEHKHHFHHRTW